METGEINSDCIVVATGDVPFSSLHGELLGISERRGFCYSLNEPGARIWALIQTPVSIGRVCATLSAEFAVDPDRCRDDVAGFIVALEAAGLIEVRSGST
jgi:hypothetical protein